eukprot:g17492.t1
MCKKVSFCAIILTSIGVTAGGQNNEDARESVGRPSLPPGRSWDVVLDGLASREHSRFFDSTSSKATEQKGPEKGLVHCACRKVPDDEANWETDPEIGYADAGRRVRCRFFFVGDQEAGRRGKFLRKPSVVAGGRSASDYVARKLHSPVSWRDFAQGLLGKNSSRRAVSRGDVEEGGAVFRKSVLGHLAAVSSALMTEGRSELVGDYHGGEDELRGREKSIPFSGPISGGVRIESIPFSGPISGGVRIETNQYLKDGSNFFEFVLFTSDKAPRDASAANKFNGTEPVSTDGLISNELPQFTRGPLTSLPGGVVTRTPDNYLVVCPEPRFVEGRNKDAMHQCTGPYKGTWHCYASLGLFLNFAPVRVVEEVFARLGNVLDKTAARVPLATPEGERVAQGAASFNTRGARVKWVHIRVGTPGQFKWWLSPYRRSAQEMKNSGAAPLLEVGAGGDSCTPVSSLAGGATVTRLGPAKVSNVKRKREILY